MTSSGCTWRRHRWAGPAQALAESDYAHLECAIPSVKQVCSQFQGTW